MHWIPSHVGIRSNEVVDETVKLAAAGPAITRTVLPTLQQVKMRARRAVEHLTHETHLELEANKRQAAWCAAATHYTLDTGQQQPRSDAVLLQRVRLGYST